MARSFYSDQEEVLPTPGVNQAISKDLKKKEDTLHDPHKKLVEGKVITVNSTLENYAKKARQYALQKLEIFEAEYNNLHAAYLNEKRNFLDKYHQLVVEPVLPSGLYVLTAMLTGSIIVRTRSLPTRFVTPVVFGLASFSYLMPQTSSNTFNWLDAIKREQLPETSKQLDEAKLQVSKLASDIDQTRAQWRQQLTDSVRCVRKEILSRTEEK
ncbi:hypothetical protein OGAPHI_002517 [Ogataea philodendri]|uniref:MICOS complex subunit n=1 Tax=Ogataea philodendri TaxID=1378263 RepID=A0A9P8PB62_9ASCO|nr:uncharacterized protein OGAPHI_002517 [Ogataea philodendri]KAH3668762.1 hypothetical protein OGAPHI_002517 [Ogataea philodendri]